MKVCVLREPEIRQLIGPEKALTEVRRAFAQLSRGEATVPGIIGFDIPERRGEVHVKAAYLHGAPFYSVKEATGFYSNADRGVPVGSGVILAFDAVTGFLRAVLLDNGYLTELRTGAAGALAADLLAKPVVAQVGVLGSGVQARYQLEALLTVRCPQQVVAFSPSSKNVLAYAREMQSQHGIAVKPVSSVRDVVEGSDVVITATSARDPIVRASWILPGTHITAVGSDGPEKQELDVGVLAKATKIAVDHRAQSLEVGEVHHAVAAGVIEPRDIYGELGELAAGWKPGRESDDEITIADLTGVGIQDAAVANYVVCEAIRLGFGQVLES